MVDDGPRVGALLKIVTSVVYRSRPVRWRLRRTLEQEKAKLERYQHEFEQLPAVQDLDQKERAELLQRNQEFIADLTVLVESFRPAVFQDKGGLEELKDRNEKLFRAVKKQAAEQQKKTAEKKDDVISPSSVGTDARRNDAQGNDAKGTNTAKKE